MVRVPDERRPREADRYQVPHRKNAAEWAMWAALLPLVPVALLLERLRSRKEARRG